MSLIFTFYAVRILTFFTAKTFLKFLLLENFSAIWRIAKEVLFRY